MNLYGFLAACLGVLIVLVPVWIIRQRERRARNRTIEKPVEPVFIPSYTVTPSVRALMDLGRVPAYSPRIPPKRPGSISGPVPESFKPTEEPEYRVEIRSSPHVDGPSISCNEAAVDVALGVSMLESMLESISTPGDSFSGGGGESGGGGASGEW